MQNNWLDFIDSSIKSEDTIHLHSKEERSHLFSSFSKDSSEIEILNFLNAAVQIFKPALVLETGSYMGFSTIAIASALKANGFGKLTSLEIKKEFAEKTNEKLSTLGLSLFAEVILSSSLEFIKALSSEIKYEFIYFDSEISIRKEEFKNLYKNGNLTNIVVFHDTSRLRTWTHKTETKEHREFIKYLDFIEKEYCCGAIELGLSRGLRIMQLKPKINPAFRISNINNREIINANLDKLGCLEYCLKRIKKQRLELRISRANNIIKEKFQFKKLLKHLYRCRKPQDFFRLILHVRLLIFSIYSILKGESNESSNEKV